ncbi:lipid-A-disaccharide synthase [Rickettsiella endosymbiont of Rhagonycha lignosa]|uniref:lipid-A-disaccharide synthase n=1 Tax=Rickettsiella endosymbiont of Rhagonycha lignosa TaxID=3077937 RepID=UPI00313B788B
MASFVKLPLRIGIVVGEASGDLLAADLCKELKRRQIPFSVSGIAGPELQQQGVRSLFPMERLSVMGLGEILKQLPQLLRCRREVTEYFIAHPPDVFIGVDAPEFNLDLEKKLKKHGIRTLHYVSPSVWAWRRWRLKKIAKAVDLMLCLFPFEKCFYEEHDIPVQFVGHPSADEIPFSIDSLAARKTLGLPESAAIIAILPGSRRNEINYLGELFLKTAQDCYQQNPKLVFVVAMVNQEREQQFLQLAKQITPDLPLQFVRGQSRQVMAAANVVLLASGTATLEAMLLKKPMVVAYRMSKLSYWMAKLLIKVDYIALPNLLAKKLLVPEFIQEKANVDNLSQALLYYLNNADIVSKLEKEFLVLHQQLRCHASKQAVDAVLKILSTHV